MSGPYLLPLRTSAEKNFKCHLPESKPRAKPSVSTLEFCLPTLLPPAPRPRCQVHFRISKAFCLLLANMKLHLADAMIIMKIMITKVVFLVGFPFPQPVPVAPILVSNLMCRDLCSVFHTNSCPLSLQPTRSILLHTPFFSWSFLV